MATALVAGFAVSSFILAPVAAATTADEPLEIEGEVDGLFPGAETTLQAQVTNPHPFPIEVTAFDVTVGDASDSCPASALEIGPAAVGVVIDPGETGVVPVPVQMASSAPDACQGATWPLTYVATAVQVGSGGEGPPVSPNDPFVGLPLTGVALAGLLVIGILLVLTGVLVVRAARRKTGGARG